MITKQNKSQIIQGLVRLWRIVQLIRMIHKWCIITPNSLRIILAYSRFRLIIQLSHYICFTTNKNNHSWLRGLKEWLNLVATHAFAFLRSVNYFCCKTKMIFYTLKTVFTNRYSKWNKHILSLNSFILFSFVLLENYDTSKIQHILQFLFC